MRGVCLACALCVLAAARADAQAWVPQVSNTKVDLRGISAVNANVAWAGGPKGTFLRTTDGGANWSVGVVTGSADADFRAVHGFSEKSALFLSCGAGPLSRLYRTSDGGITWELVMVNAAANGFWDAMGMWDPLHGVLLGDPVNGRFVIWTISDGMNWEQQKGPQALNGEGAFAASNSGLFLRGAREAWFGTGGPEGARIFHSDDSGKTWTVVKKVRHDPPNPGISSLAFSHGLHGVVAAGASGAIAITADGGRTWDDPETPPAGYRSAVVYLDQTKAWIAAGPTGSDISTDDGKTWKMFDSASYVAMSFAGSTGWAVGPAGAIARYRAR